MLHVCPDEVTGRESAAERQLTGKHSGSHNAGKTASILARMSRVWAANAQHVEHSGLRVENGTSTKSADLERRHGDGDLERTTKAEKSLVSPT